VDKPEAPSEPLIRVIAAVIRRGDEYLVCQRPAHKRHGGLWEFPGGKCEQGESDFEAARRELREELCVDVVRIGDPLFTAHDEGSPYVIVFVPTEILGEPTAQEHDAIRWVTASNLESLVLAPSDGRFAERCMRDGNYPW
jgi:mutator protein MutT